MLIKTPQGVSIISEGTRRDRRVSGQFGIQVVLLSQRIEVPFTERKISSDWWGHIYIYI